MRAFVAPISDLNLSRTVQLINKTNQFNLTTRRMTEAEVQALVANDGFYTSTIRLDDRFGSNGLISVVIGRIVGDSLDIETWLMSCRVLKRGVEYLEMEQALDFCRRRGLRSVVGRYLPTAKNKLVSGHYAELGFVEIPGAAEGTSWRFDLQTTQFARTHFITRGDDADRAR